MIFFGVFVFATHFRSVVHCAVPPNRDTFDRGERQPNLLGADHGFRTSQAGQRLFSGPAAAAAGQVLAKPTPLGRRPEEIIEPDGVRIQGRGLTRQPLRHLRLPRP
jgi:hypothetical protein